MRSDFFQNQVAVNSSGMAPQAAPSTPKHQLPSHKHLRKLPGEISLNYHPREDVNQQRCQYTEVKLLSMRTVCSSPLPLLTKVVNIKVITIQEVVNNIQKWSIYKVALCRFHQQMVSLPLNNNPSHLTSYA